jgi:hypothetical protein
MMRTSRVTSQLPVSQEGLATKELVMEQPVSSLKVKQSPRGLPSLRAMDPAWHIRAEFALETQETLTHIPSDCAQLQ